MSVHTGSDWVMPGLGFCFPPCHGPRAGARAGPAGAPGGHGGHLTLGLGSALRSRGLSPGPPEPCWPRTRAPCSRLVVFRQDSQHPRACQLPTPSCPAASGLVPPCLPGALHPLGGLLTLLPAPPSLPCMEVLFCLLPAPAPASPCPFSYSSPCPCPSIVYRVTPAAH